MWVSPDEHKVVGEILMAVRKRQGVSQDELAHRLKKPQSFISSFENGQRRVDLLEFLRICTAIGVDPGAVFQQICEAASRSAG